jgi:hypothetical protein
VEGKQGRCKDQTGKYKLAYSWMSRFPVWIADTQALFAERWAQTEDVPYLQGLDLLAD